MPGGKPAVRSRCWKSIRSAMPRDSAAARARLNAVVETSTATTVHPRSASHIASAPSPQPRSSARVPFSSPLKRAHDTAKAAADALGLTVEIDDDLIETDFGEWEGLTFPEAAKRHPEVHGRWLRDTSLQPPGGESFDEVQHRVQRARDRIIVDHGPGTVLVVSHVTPIKTLLRLALGAGPSILHRLHLDLASLSIAEFYPDDGASVRLVNDTSYLGRT